MVKKLPRLLLIFSLSTFTKPASKAEHPERRRYVNMSSGRQRPGMWQGSAGWPAPVQDGIAQAACTTNTAAAAVGMLCSPLCSQYRTKSSRSLPLPLPLLPWSWPQLQGPAAARDWASSFSW